MPDDDAIAESSFSNENTALPHHSSHLERYLHKVKTGNVQKSGSRSRLSISEKKAHKNQKLNTWKTTDMEDAMKMFHDTRNDSTPPTILDIADKYGLPYTTLWKRVKGVVEGTGH